MAGILALSVAAGGRVEKPYLIRGLETLSWHTYTAIDSYCRIICGAAETL
jgi:hypothetical protein